MAQLLVRNVRDDLVRALKLRAARHGRSAEAEHREILKQTLEPRRPGKTFKEFLLAMPPVGEDKDFERLPDRGRRVKL